VFIFTFCAPVWTSPEPAIFVALQRVKEVLANLEKKENYVNLNAIFDASFFGRREMQVKIFLM